MSLEHKDGLPVAQQSDGRRRGRILRKVASRLSRSLRVLAGKNGCQQIGACRMPEGQCYGRARLSRRAAAYGIYKDQCGAFGLAQGFVHFLGCPQFTEPEPSQLFSHRLDHFFRIHAHTFILQIPQSISYTYLVACSSYYNEPHIVAEEQLGLSKSDFTRIMMRILFTLYDTQ